ncbi:(2Fe-2S)-binding protein [Agrobacterium rubi]|nr:(2Fe-2S)-binding protein [Agrobacterium rubi]NTF24611.1 (2Fe-2S)-binding protein [Agrobacterium rubi]
MIVCSCNYITEKDIVSVIEEMLAVDPWQLIVPGKVYKAMEKRGKCCGCFPNVVEIIVRTTTEHHIGLKSEERAAEALIIRLREVGEDYRRIRSRLAS